MNNHAIAILSIAQNYEMLIYNRLLHFLEYDIKITGDTTKTPSLLLWKL